MNLNTLPKLNQKKGKRLGRGHGSGRGKTAGRGTKGQNARGRAKLYFEGGSLPLIKRLPFLRGRGKNKVFKRKPVIINVKVLNILPENTIVDLEAIIKHKILDEDMARSYGVKILGEGEISKSLEIRLPVSKGARAKIEKAGGKIV